MPDAEFVQLGAVAVLFLVAIREFFSYLKFRKSDQKDQGSHDIAILQELRSMNNNHLNSLKDAINDGNRNLIDTIHNDNTKMIEILGEIKGGLKR